jgi:hypothetical protein
METSACPIIVFCVESIGKALGESIARLSHENYPASALSVRSVRADQGGYIVTPIVGFEPLDAQPEPPIIRGAINDIVCEVIVDALSLVDYRIPATMQKPISLRLAVIGAPWEVTPSLLLDFAAAFHSSAQQHCGARYLAEGYFVLPYLDRSAPPDAAEQVRDLLRVVEARAPGVDPPFSTDSFSYCWWFGQINAAGLALPSFPASLDDVATVILGVLTTSPEQLPLSITILTGRTQHMSAGYGEFFAPREALFEYLRARRACQLIHGLFLDRIDQLDHRRVRRRAWAFTLSSACAGVLRDVELTPGGERIWKGFHPTIPKEALNGEVDEFLSNLRDSWRRFSNMDRGELRRRFELSGRTRGEEFLTEIEIEVQDMVERGNGGLFEARSFLEEMEAFLLETKDVSEGEKVTNLQKMRRQFDRTFADALHIKQSPSPNEHESEVRELRRQLARLTRLRNISAPPALSASVFEALVWGETSGSLDEAIAATTQRLQEEVTSWAQEAANAEGVLQRARYEIEPEAVRREQEMEKKEEALRETAQECRRLRFELELARNTSRRRLFGRKRQERSLQDMNERLAQLQGVMLQQQAREVVLSYANRMQLSIDWMVYEVRDNIIHDALDQVRRLHQKISGAIEMLNEMSDRFSSVEPPTDSHLLRTPLITDVDLESLLEQLTKVMPGTQVPNCPSAWAVCSQPPEKTEAQLLEAAGRPLTVVRNWTIADFVRVLRIPNRKLEALSAWLQHISQPLLQTRGEDTVDYSIIRAVEDPDLDPILRHTFPEATRIDHSNTQSVSVLQLRHVPRVEASVLGFQTRESIADYK